MVLYLVPKDWITEGFIGEYYIKERICVKDLLEGHNSAILSDMSRYQYSLDFHYP
jgi:hypothetical protein